MVVSYHAKFQLITTTGSRFFRTVFVEILRPPLLALVPEAGLPISGSDVETHLKPRTFIRLLAAENLTVVEGRFPANCLLYGLEIFVAAAVINGLRVLYNATSVNPTTELVFRFIKALRAYPQWKNESCSYSHAVQISTRREVFLSAVLITSRTNVSRWLFMLKDPRGRLLHCTFQLYGKKRSGKNETKGTCKS